MFIKNYYTELGKLLFAIAKSDGKVHKKEVEGFRKLITQELLCIEDTVDKFGTDMAFYTEFEFDLLLDSDTTANDAFNSFIEFSKTNKHLMNNGLKKVAYNLADKIADLYGGINKVEGRKLAELKTVLEL